MDIPSLFMIPSAVSSGKVHSVFPNSTDADFDFNRDSDATRVNSEGLIERVGYYGGEKITNGTFDADSNWGKSSGATISNGKANIVVTGGSFQYIDQGVTYVVGKKYRLTATIQGTSGKALRFQDNASNTGGLQVSNGTVNFNGNIQAVDITWAANSNSNILIIARSGAGDFSFTVDNVSVVEITGDRARLNYEIEGGLVNTKPSLLLEPQSTNLITESNNVIDSDNVFSNMSGLINQVTSPEGVKNAGRLIENTANSDHYFQRGLAAISSSNYYTVSFFAKYNGRGASVNIGASRLYAHFDLQAGTVIASGNNSDWQNLSTDIINYGNGWYKCVLTGQSVTGVAGYIRVHTNNGITSSYTSSYTGDGKSGIFIYGIQFEQQAYCTSYIPTNGSTQTRAAETCNGAGTSSILPSEEGILYGEFAALANDETFRLFSLSNGTSANRVYLGFGSGSNTIWCSVSNSNVGQAAIIHTISDVKLFNKAAIRFKANDVQLYVNGVQVGTDTSATIPSDFSSVQFNSGSGSSALYAKIRDIRVYNTKEMTDSEVDILLTKITS